MVKNYTALNKEYTRRKYFFYFLQKSGLCESYVVLCCATVERVASSNLHAGIYDILHDYQLYPNDVIVDMLDEIVKNGAISDTSLRMVVKKIIITERKGKLKIKIQLNADFSTHIDFLHDEDDPMYNSHGDILVVEK